MKISKTVFISAEAVKEKHIVNKDDTEFCGVSVFKVETVYTRKKGANLLQEYTGLVSSDTSGKVFQRRSADNGKTWSDPSVIYKPERTKEGILRQSESILFLDGERDAIVKFYNLSLYPMDHYTYDVEKYTRIFYEISFDGGKTFSQPKQLIQKGLNEKNWAEGVIYGQNCAEISFCVPVKSKSGKILLPIYKTPVILEHNRHLYQNEAGCFIGEWKGESIEWELSETVKIDPQLSSRGLSEPALAELKNGYILMICRGSNDSITHVPGYKWYSISKDKGYTWSEPSPLKYDTGENFYSPATGSRLIRSSNNNKLYWMGNIVKANPDGNRPRHPLQIAEVDEKNMAVKKNTVEIIDERKKEDSSFVQLSNFRVYEDRETHEFVLNMARIQEKSREDLTSPSYQYRIKILTR